MKHYSYFGIIVLVLIMACDDDDPTIGVLPDCITSITVDNPLITIQAQEIDQSTYYWLNTGFNEADVDEYIVSSTCDTVCYYGGWQNPDCANNYLADGWKIVWP